MNKTKKRAAKRAALKNTTVTRRPHARKPRFMWPFPLIIRHKIDNLKAYREYHGCTLREAKDAVEAVTNASRSVSDSITF